MWRAARCYARSCLASCFPSGSGIPLCLIGGILRSALLLAAKPGWGRWLLVLQLRRVAGLLLRLLLRSLVMFSARQTRCGSPAYPTGDVRASYTRFRWGEHLLQFLLLAAWVILYDHRRHTAAATATSAATLLPQLNKKRAAAVKKVEVPVVVAAGETPAKKAPIKQAMIAEAKAKAKAAQVRVSVCLCARAL